MEKENLSWKISLVKCFLLAVGNSDFNLLITKISKHNKTIFVATNNFIKITVELHNQTAKSSFIYFENIKQQITADQRRLIETAIDNDRIFKETLAKQNADAQKLADYFGKENILHLK